MVSPLRLQVFPKLPTHEVVCFVMQQATATPGRQVELPFLWEEKVVPYLLSVTSRNSGSPEWTLSTDGNDAPVIWTHSTGDVGSILNMVVSQCKGAAEETLDHRTSYTNLPALAQLRDRKSTKDSLVRFQSMAEGLKENKTKGVTLEGDLTDVPIFSLLQSINITKMTGRLSVSGPQAQAEVFFRNGSPVHASTLNETGDRAIIEMVLIENGKFQFFPSQKNKEETVKKRLDTLLMEGAVLLDQSIELERAGLNPDAFILRKYPSITENEFENAVSKGTPLDLSAQKHLYAHLDSKSTLFDLTRSGKAKRLEVIPILFNLWNCGLVSFSARPDQSRQHELLASSAIDTESQNSANALLLRQDTGLLPFPLFLHFLDIEHARFERSRLPYALIVFEVMKSTSAGLEHVPPATIKLVAQKLSAVKRKFDLLAHVQTFECALLLPMTDLKESCMVAQRLSALIMEAGENGPELRVSIGVAAVPEDCSQPSILLAAALEAKLQASKESSNIVIYGHLATR